MALLGQIAPDEFGILHYAAIAELKKYKNPFDAVDEAEKDWKVVEVIL